MVKPIDKPAPIHRFSRRALLAAGALPVLAACGGEDAAAPTPTAITNTGTPIVQIPRFTDTARWNGRSLRVGAFGGEIQAALRDRVFQAFAAATGCVVQEVTTDYAQLAASYTPEGEPYADVLLVDAFWARSALSASLVEPIPADRVDAARFGPIPAFDGAAPAFAYAMVSTFRRDAVETAGEPDSWRGWWDDAAYAGARTLPKGPLGSFEFALLADGVDRRSLYPLDVARATEKLNQIRGKIADLWWESGDQPLLWLSRQRADLAAAWHYRTIAAQRDGRPVSYVWDDGLLIADQWVIPKGTKAVDIAADFIDYATTPEIQASLAAAVPLGPVNPAAFPLIDPRTASRLPTAPDRVERLIQVDTAWWAQNMVEVNQQFDRWLIEEPANGA